MSWQWVTLVLGFFVLVSILVLYTTWSNMKLRMFELAVNAKATVGENTLIQWPGEKDAGTEE